jgi:lipid II:glycine glycyltransferase (peptidoglycan interpeptide bridge formation enzyme)
MSFQSVSNHPLQSPEWAEFRKAWGNRVVDFPFGQITVHQIPFLPYKIGIFEKGPVPTKEMLTTLKSYAKENRLLFIKLEPCVPASINHQLSTTNHPDKLIKLLKENGAVQGKTLFTPSTFWIDLTKSEEELMKGFSSKTRYNIRLAQRNRVKVVEDNSDKAFEKYLELTRETVERQGFFAHTEKYHRLMWKHLHQLPSGPVSDSEKSPTRGEARPGRRPIAHLLTAVYNKEIITCWIVFVYKDFLYYPYGASTEKYKNVMANNLMMWEAIKYGKKLGLKTFDLWGREPGKGFTKFKEGYNPQVIEFLGTWDLVINKPLYYIYRTIEYLRWKLLKIPAKFGLIKPKF